MRSVQAVLTGVLLSSCILPLGETPAVVDPDALPDPEITQVTLSCDREAGRWSVDVRTSAWTGGGRLLWTTDGDYVEQHSGLRSVRAGADGLSDRLALDIAIVDDVRGVSDGRTALRCTADPAVAILITSLDDQLSDCVRKADDPRLDGLDALPEGCDRSLDEDTDG